MNEGQNTPLLSVIIPCLNEADGIEAIYARVRAIAKETVTNNYEILFIDDGSTDDTRLKIEALSRTDRAVTLIALSRNYGHQMALSAGLMHCRGERAFILDADLQDPPELLPLFMKALDEGADIAYGQRLRRMGESFFKRQSAFWFYKIMTHLADTPVPENTGDFRLISRRAIDLINKMPERSRFLRGMMGWLGLKQTAIPYERAPRLTGKTKYPLHKMLHFAVDGLTSFSIRPLRIAAYAGAAFGIIGLGLLVYVFYSWLTGQTVQGWTSLMAVILVIGSIQLIALGVFGEYLGRLYIEAKQRPPYIIDEIKYGSDNSV